MKVVYFLFLLLAVVSSAEAASFQWGGGSVRVQFPTSTYVIDGSATGYLVYLGTTGATYDISGYNVLNDVVGTQVSTRTGMAATKGRMDTKFEVAQGAPIPNTDDGVMDNGAVFGMFITKVVDGVTWINVSSSTHTVAGMDDWVGAPLPGAYFTFNWAQNEPGTALTSGGGWTAQVPDTPEPPVPEPATASIALAGLALLFKRRKA